MDKDQIEAQKRWLGPSAALNRFNQRHAVHIDTSLVVEEKVTYGFLVGHIGLLIPPSTISEIFEPPPISPLPDTANWFVGLCNLRGNIIPVYEIETLLQVRKENESGKKLLVIGRNDSALGILISGLPLAMQLHDSHMMTELPPVPEKLEEYVSKAYMQDEHVWFEFDHDRFFTAIASEVMGLP